MNSFDYLEVSVLLNPFTEEMAEILTAELSELPFEAFVTEEPCLKCYIQTVNYRPSDVKVILSGYPAASGFTAAPVLAVLVCSLFVYLKGRKDGEDFPFLLRRDVDDRTFIYDFEINEDNTVAMSQTADAVIESFSISEKIQVFAGLMVEEMLLRIRDENPGKRVFAECTIMVEEEGVRLILRDSGKIFDITDTDTLPDSFREYVVANLMIAAQEYKSYITTTGYNRNELFFPR